ncbi:MAG TPA: nuclear transport factor 2 family protein [Steroidobacteraceae bacterium]|nr:nuclear transport factor 2 family protein [Steroidobacteraceae bacterium]
MSQPGEPRESFAGQWAACWNRRDVEAVLRHFHEDVVFTSPTALAVVGVATLHGKKALRDYWYAAMARIGSIRFTVDRVAWDAVSRELAIIYVAEFDGKAKRVSENLVFDDSGLVVAAEVFHGVPA